MVREGIQEKVTFDFRAEGSEEDSPTGIWGESVSGRGDSRFRGTVGGPHLASLGWEHSEAGAWGTSEQVQGIPQRADEVRGAQTTWAL